jgi:hypothetical protein
VASGPVHCEENFQFSWNHGEERCQGAVLVRVGGTWHSAGFGELKADTWYHLVGTYDGENLKAYKDGVLITDMADPSGDADSGIAKLTFGRHATSPDAFFTGVVDDVCVYAYALSGNNIQALHAGAEPSDVAARPVTEAPHLLDATPTEAAQPTVAAAAASATAAEPNAQIQPVSAQVPAADAARRGGKHGVAAIVIIGIVGLIAGVSLFTRQKSQ